MQVILVHGNANELWSLKVQSMIAPWTLNLFASICKLISDSGLPVLLVCSLNSPLNLFLHFISLLIN